MTFGLDLVPSDLNTSINRDHLLIKEYLPTKFEASSILELSVALVRLRDTDIQTDQPTCAKQYAPLSLKGGRIKILFIWPSF